MMPRVCHVAGLSEAMLRGGSWQLGEKGTHYIKTIKNSSHHLANIINDILDAAAFSKGRLVIKREKASLPLLPFRPFWLCRLLSQNLMSLCTFMWPAEVLLLFF